MVLLPGKEGSSRVTHLKNKLTMMINGEEGLNHNALQFVMQTNMRTNSKKSYTILQEALEAGLVPKTGAITFEIAESSCDYDLIIAIDVSQEQDDFKVASLVTTVTPFEGSIACMHAFVTLIDAKGIKGDIIPYKKMKQLLEKIKVKGKNVIIYRHNCSVEYKEVFQNEIQGTLDHFPKDSHISFIQVSSNSSLRILDVPDSDLGK
jgi:argonaute-like protein implicated in RNA metabolism and viral defense